MWTLQDQQCKWIPLDKPDDIAYARTVYDCFHRIEGLNKYADLVGYHGLRNSCQPRIKAVVNALQGKLGPGTHISFVGDSTMKQQFVHFACMLNPDLNKKKLKWNDFKVKWKIKGIVLTLEKFGQNWDKYGRFKIGEYGNYLRYLFSARNDKDVVLLNHGLHFNFNSDQNLSENIRQVEMLQSWTSVSVRIYAELMNERGLGVMPRLMWRETTPQHFPTPNGLYAKCNKTIAAAEGRSCTCRNFLNSVYEEGKKVEKSRSDFKDSISANIRNEISNPIISVGGHIQLLLNFDQLKAEPKFHLGTTDCTHLGGDALLFLNIELAEGIMRPNDG